VKQISGIKGSDMSIPPILHNDNLIFDDIERANLFNIYFSKQSEIDDSNSNIPNLLHVTNQINNRFPPGILISDPLIPEICLTMFHQILQEEFMFVFFFIKSLLYLSFGVPY
jgi:hypothetical protein